MLKINCFKEVSNLNSTKKYKYCHTDTWYRKIRLISEIQRLQFSAANVKIVPVLETITLEVKH